MKEGLLWFDDDPTRILSAKVTLAVRCYREKYGADPSTCYVHASALDGECQVGDVRVVPLPTVLLHHFWVGQEPPGVRVEARAEALRSAAVQVAEVGR